MISVKKYTTEEERMWNSFNKQAKNSLFMFDRNYMNYHSDRFTDHSLMFYDDGKLVAILPASIYNDTLYSHGGLTYGGFISGDKMRQITMNKCFSELIGYAEKNHIRKIIYKTIPYIYHSQPAEEDRYALYTNGAKLLSVDVSTYVNLSNPLPMRKNMKGQVKKAIEKGCTICKLTAETDYEEFIRIENSILLEKHNTTAAHTGKELKLLHDRFPDCIHLYGAMRNGEMLGGAVIYEYEDVVHTQYMAANEEAREIRALDLTITTIIGEYEKKKKWLDFGISTEHGRIFLNEGLVSQKEGFGGRTGVYNIWEIKI